MEIDRVNGVEHLSLTLNRNGGGLGLTIAGGKGSTPYIGEDDSVFISRVTEGGAADRAGLKVGDKLLKVKEIFLGILI